MSIEWNEQAERAVVGAILSAGCLGPEPGWSCVDRAISQGLFPNDFYMRSLGRVYSVCCQLRQEGLPVDPISVDDAIGKRFGEDVYMYGRLRSLSMEHWPMTLIERHARIIVEKAAARREGGES